MNISKNLNKKENLLKKLFCNCKALLITILLIKSKNILKF